MQLLTLQHFILIKLHIPRMAHLVQHIPISICHATENWYRGISWMKQNAADKRNTITETALSFFFSWSVLINALSHLVLGNMLSSGTCVIRISVLQTRIWIQTFLSWCLLKKKKKKKEKTMAWQYIFVPLISSWNRLIVTGFRKYSLGTRLIRVCTFHTRTHKL